MLWREQLLAAIDLGKSVAEQDDNLNNYYVDTEMYEEVTTDRIDIVRGQKGSGKSAILKRMLSKGVPGVRLSTAENLTGDLVFRQVFAAAFDHPDKMPAEQILADAWKIYFLSVAVDELEEHVKKELGWFQRQWFTLRKLGPLQRQLKNYRILIGSKDLKTKLQFAVKRVGVTITDPNGNSYEPFADVDLSKRPAETGIPFNDMYASINQLLGELGVRVWVCLDKLDEAFQNLPREVEAGALRSLLTAYKDVMNHRNLRIKIFIRDDIYHKVTNAGFTALTHIQPRTSSFAISWSHDKLLHLLASRLLFPNKVKELLSQRGISTAPSNPEERLSLLLTLFPMQIDAGKESNTFTWIVNRVKDGKGISTPRDVINLVTNSKTKQVEFWTITPPTEDSCIVIESKAFKQGLKQLSEDKLRTHLYAEYPNLKPAIECFKGLKSRYDINGIKEVLGEHFPLLVQLRDVGFLQEQEGGTWYFPFVYRDGLDIRQGAYGALATAKKNAPQNEDDEDEGE